MRLPFRSMSCSQNTHLECYRIGLVQRRNTIILALHRVYLLKDQAKLYSGSHGDGTWTFGFGDGEFSESSDLLFFIDDVLK